MMDCVETELRNLDTSRALRFAFVFVLLQDIQKQFFSSNVSVSNIGLQ